MKYYRYWIEKEFAGQIRETDKAIALEIAQQGWVYHEAKVKYMWCAKSQIIIEESEYKGTKMVNYYIPVWMIKKNHLNYNSFDGIGTFFRESDYLVER